MFFSLTAASCEKGIETGLKDPSICHEISRRRLWLFGLYGLFRFLHLFLLQGNGVSRIAQPRAALCGYTVPT